MASLLKIAVVQLLPQWQDTPPDSITYWLNAKAIALHWSHLAVDAETYRLKGGSGTTWTIDSHLAIPDVLGTRAWIYAAYIASWIHFADASRQIVILSNGLWSSFFPPAVFCIAMLLGVQRRIAVYAGLVAAVDPMTGVNAAHLLKDTITCFLFTTAIWAALILTFQSKTKIAAASVCFVPATTVLYCLRSISFYSIMMAMIVVALLLALKRCPQRCLLIMGLIVITWITSHQLAICSLSWPHISSSQHMQQQGIHHPTGAGIGGAFISQAGPIIGAFNSLHASNGSNGYDPTVAAWLSSLQGSPLQALTISALRSLFAPNLLAIAKPGMNWHDAHELYYPGMILWIGCLPFLFISIRYLMARLDPAHLLILMILVIHLAAYIVMYGEFSGRQRVLVVPICIALSALGFQIFTQRRQPLLKASTAILRHEL